MTKARWAAFLSLTLLLAWPASAWSAPRVTVKGAVKVGATLVAGVSGGKASSFLWERCETLAPDCDDPSVVSRQQGIAVRPADAGYHLRVTATVRSRKISSRWSIAVPKPARTEKPYGLTIANPVPLGQALLDQDGYLVRVDRYEANATEKVIAMWPAGSPPSAPPLGYEYVLIYLTVTNLRGETGAFAEFRPRLLDKSGESIESDYWVNFIRGPGPPGIGQNIPPGMTVSGFVSRTVPVGAPTPLMCDKGPLAPLSTCLYFKLTR